MRLRVFDELCKRCGLCARVCRRGGLERGEVGSLPVVNERCNGCGLCVPLCPDFALEVVGEGAKSTRAP